VTLLVYTQQLKNDMQQAQWRVPSYASNAQRDGGPVYDIQFYRA
jgi:hypothetical protein